MEVALHRPAPQGGLGPVPIARHRQDGQAAHARPTPSQLPILRRTGGFDVHDRSRPPAGQLAGLRHVPAKHHGRGPRARTGHLPAGGLHAVSPTDLRVLGHGCQRATGVRHVAGPRRPSGHREHAGHRARAGGALCALPGRGRRRAGRGDRSGAMKPAVLVCRAVFADVVDRLLEHFEVESNDADVVWTTTELVAHLQGKAGVFITGTQPIDAALLQACPELRAVCSMAVGYNNVDVAACTERGVLVSNAPDVLTETTADFGFALMMAAARRIAESEHFLRRGEWTKWSVELFAGSDVHGATLGILGMGRIGRAIARRGAHGFAMKVIYHNRSRLPEDVAGSLGARYVSREALLREA